MLARFAAIMIPLPSHVLGDDERKRFLREARSAARLQHPNICPIYAVGELAGGLPYITMAFIEGQTLHAWCRERHPNPRQTAEMVAQLARAVAYAHDQGIIHRDLKPGNVMVQAADGRPMLMDFGLARHVRQLSRAARPEDGGRRV